MLGCLFVKSIYFFVCFFFLLLFFSGITSRLDYFPEIGVDTIWLSPIYESPMADFGYDVSNFKNIDPIFGTLDDFDAMIAKMHQLGKRCK